MTSLLKGISLRLFFFWIFATETHSDFLEVPQNGSILSLAEEETVLPCRYQPSAGNVVVQVTWIKETSADKKDQMITAHHLNGQTAFGTWARRVRFKSSEPTVDSSLVIMSTDISDEGKYICHISTFPSGNFDSEMSLTVWTIPISSITPVILVEGQSYRQAASCRSIARPPPRLSWDTDLNGQSTNRSSDNGAVSSQYSLHPLRSMNGKKLDCLVWHATSHTPRRLSNQLVVHYAPYAEVSGYNKDWSVGKENAFLKCMSGGNPKPQSFTWIRKGGELPQGVILHPNGTLLFGRPLNLSDAGVYQCEAKNTVGVSKAEVEIVVAESSEQVNLPEHMLMLIVLIVAVGLLILMVATIITVTCHHRRKNLKLKQELTEKKEEITTLSRQASFRRMNSVSTDTRGATDENIPLRVEGTLRTSLSSLGEQAHCRDSRSTISGGRGGGGGGGAFDYLGRPVLHNNSRRGRERLLDRDEDSRLRVETYVRNSTMSLDTRFHPPLAPSAYPSVPSTEIVRQLNGSASIPTDGDSRPGSVARTHQHAPISCNYPPVTDDEDEVDEGLGGPASQEHPDDQYSETNSSQVSESHSMRYQQTNGTLRPKPRPNPTIISPHTSLIHKAQIV
ncbi:nectin-4-like isoform X1 [Echeneis naucrates]|uniref:Nectin-4-like n=1 Tax=Echeneis naucrates TaxID=173247 RepID=A0A665T6K1_ECHNA|nr:nectin-4-like isoform X1 [Echeneis naucrates]XP_029382257.1 nectin-4-like isoform X1 [Echeneis naucrates]